MTVPMMDVWEMNVFMNHDFVPVWVGMRLDAVPRKIVYVLVVHVMSMSVRVVDCIVCVLMFVSFAQMQPKTDRHKYAGDAQLHRDGVAEEKHRQESAEEWCDRKISAGPRCSQVP